MHASPNQMKLGVFAINAHGGCTITTAREVQQTGCVLGRTPS